MTGNGKYRDLKYSDIVVLMRSTKVNGELLQEILESNNIPSFLQKEEYFEKREIKLMLTLNFTYQQSTSGYSACKRYAFTDR